MTHQTEVYIESIVKVLVKINDKLDLLDEGTSKTNSLLRAIIQNQEKQNEMLEHLSQAKTD